ncbi:hypothetical protein HELRODRAFT_159400 [Helobdella robusta]|uniref:Cilia- and flagella-associated protein 126 n=1 Tax=Helobdella robusta TaxID=6412 RepID=T1EP03_HELRO|nr:hypothetical protein HELRODRAFT_159400 [Helobdella robusta]ESO12815.1 hypothetical protein HELRODRAFT_159400 [Helobdella robusta]
MSQDWHNSQYRDSFEAKRLGNWEIPKERDCTLGKKTMIGFTHFIGNDRGHLYGTAKKNPKGPWGGYIDTFNLPKKIPGPRSTVPTSRRAELVDKFNKEAKKFKDELIVKALPLKEKLKYELRTKQQTSIYSSNNAQVNDDEIDNGNACDVKVAGDQSNKTACAGDKEECSNSVGDVIDQSNNAVGCDAQTDNCARPIKEN